MMTSATAFRRKVAVAVAIALTLTTAAASESAEQTTPTRTGYADIEGGRIAYQVYGDLQSGKTPLLVLHGSFMSADTMRPLFEPFTATRPVIAIDARGHGRSGKFPGPITYELLADDIGLMAEARLIAELATPFLDDRPPPRAIGLFEGMDTQPGPVPGSGNN